MNKEDIVKFLRWLGDCYGMDDKKEAERVADEYISENYPKALNTDLVIKSFTEEQMSDAYNSGYSDGLKDGLM